MNEEKSVEPAILGYLERIANSLERIADSLDKPKIEVKAAQASDMRQNIKKLCTELVMAGKSIEFLKTRYKKMSEIPEEDLVSVWDELSKL